MSGRLRRIAIDVTPLRVSRDFRLLWTGSLISALGSQFVRVGLYIQVYALTGSPAQIGLLGVSALVGNLAGTIIGGSFIDAHDRRRVLIWTQVAHVAVSGWLVAGAIGGHPPLLLLHVANLLTWGLGASDAATGRHRADARSRRAQPGPVADDRDRRTRARRRADREDEPDRRLCRRPRQLPGAALRRDRDPAAPTAAEPRRW